VCKNRYQSSTAVHDTHPQYSHYDPCISIGTLSDLLGCSSPSEHSAITYAWLPGLPHHFLSDGSSHDLSEFQLAGSLEHREWHSQNLLWLTYQPVRTARKSFVQHKIVPISLPNGSTVLAFCFF